MFRLAHPQDLLARPRALLIGIAIASVLISGCMNAVRPVPSPETRVMGDIRGVVLDDDAGGGGGSRVEFRSVAEVRWTSDALIITGMVDSPGRTGRSQLETRWFPVDDVSYYVLVRESSPGKSFWAGLGVGAATGAALLLMLLGS